MQCHGDYKCTNDINVITKRDKDAVYKGEIVCDKCQKWRDKVRTHYDLALTAKCVESTRCQRKGCQLMISIKSNHDAMMANKGMAFCKQCEISGIEIVNDTNAKENTQKYTMCSCQGDVNCEIFIKVHSNAGIDAVQKGIIVCEDCQEWRTEVSTKFTLPLKQCETTCCQKKSCHNMIRINSTAGALMANSGVAFCKACTKDWCGFETITTNNCPH